MSTISASKLRHTIEVETQNYKLDRYGARDPMDGRSTPIRAEIVEERRERKTDEKGETQTVTMVFRVRYYEGLCLSTPIRFRDQIFKIVSLVATEDQKGFEITCEARS